MHHRGEERVAVEGKSLSEHKTGHNKLETMEIRYAFSCLYVYVYVCAHIHTYSLSLLHTHDLYQPHHTYLATQRTILSYRYGHVSQLLMLGAPVERFRVRQNPNDIETIELDDDEEEGKGKNKKRVRTLWWST